MKWLINPFERIAGWQALFIGLIAMALTVVIGKVNHIAFDGVLIVNPWATYNFLLFFAMQFVHFFVLFLTMWLAGVCFSKTKVRIIDIAGTMALARVPLLLMAIIYFLPITPVSPYDIPRVVVLYFAFISFIAWMIVLMYNAYSVSCHLKGVKSVVSFVGALLVAEIVYKLVLVFLLGSLLTNVPLKSVSNSDSKEIVVVAESLTILQKTGNIVKAFERNDFEAVSVYFDENMKKGLPPSGLRMAWLQVNMQYGNFEKADMDNLKEISAEGYDIIDVPFNFQNEKINLRLAFNKDGDIGGLFFLPIN